MVYREKRTHGDRSQQLVESREEDEMRGATPPYASRVPRSGATAGLLWRRCPRFVAAALIACMHACPCPLNKLGVVLICRRIYVQVAPD